MKTTVEELRTKNLEEIINEQKPEQKSRYKDDPIYFFRYLMETGYNPPNFSIMYPGGRQG